MTRARQLCLASIGVLACGCSASELDIPPWLRTHVPGTPLVAQRDGDSYESSYSTGVYTPGTSSDYSTSPSYDSGSYSASPGYDSGSSSAYGSESSLPAEGYPTSNYYDSTNDAAAYGLSPGAETIIDLTKDLTSESGPSTDSGYTIPSDSTYTTSPGLSDGTSAFDAGTRSYDSGLSGSELVPGFDPAAAGYAFPSNDPTDSQPQVDPWFLDRNNSPAFNDSLLTPSDSSSSPDSSGASSGFDSTFPGADSTPGYDSSLPATGGIEEIYRSLNPSLSDPSYAPSIDSTTTDQSTLLPSDPSGLLGDPSLFDSSRGLDSNTLDTLTPTSGTGSFDSSSGTESPSDAGTVGGDAATDSESSKGAAADSSKGP